METEISMRFTYDHSGITDEVRKETHTRLSTLIDHLSKLPSTYQSPESTLTLPLDGAMREAIRALLEKIGIGSVKYIAVFGIGGSSAGAKAVYDALRTQQTPRMLFFETTDVRATRSFLSEITSQAKSADELLLVIVSKMGETLETIADAECVISELHPHFPEIESRIVVISNSGSPLLLAAEKRHLHTYALAPAVRGRYSIFSPAGLIPLAAAGFDVEALCGGAREMNERCLSTTSKDNPAAESAGFLSYWYKQGLKIHDLFYFGPELRSLGFWSRQILAESIGKDGIGITPTVSIGSTDLHSTAQLHLGGGGGMTVLFVDRERVDESLRVPRERLFPDLVPYLSGKSLSELMQVLRDAAVSAYAAKKVPLIGVSLGAVTERELGMYLQWKMIETIFLAELLGVDPFTEPDVASYKEHAREVLQDAHE